MKHMKKSHMSAMNSSMDSAKRSHFSGGDSRHSDPIVGGESEREGRRVGEGKFAGMPTDVEMKLFPKFETHGPDVLDDTQGHINECQKYAKNQSRRYMSNQH